MENTDIFNHLYDEKTPLVFTNGTKVYNNLKKEYITHEKGFFICGPSGIGKTYFVNHQKEKNWIDGDVLWEACGAFPNGQWWTWSIDEIDTIERRADCITEQAKKQGFWVIGTSCVSLIPDAIVLPDFETHLKYIKHRENTYYDGGIKSDNLEKIKRQRNYFSKFVEMGVPFFKSVDEAVCFLTTQKEN